MATATLGDTEFTFGFCIACDRDVLSHVDLDDADREVYRCVHCNEDLERLRSLPASELGAKGYGLVEARACGNGGGCGSGCGMRRSAASAG